MRVQQGKTRWRQSEARITRAHGQSWASCDRRTDARFVFDKDAAHGRQRAFIALRQPVQRVLGQERVQCATRLRVDIHLQAGRWQNRKQQINRDLHNKEGNQH